MALKDILFWEKYRPNTINPEKGKIPIILLPRIKKIVEKGLQLNLLLYSSGGMGKSSIAGILSKNEDVLKINCSVDRGIDIVRDKILEHCKNYSISLRKNFNKNGQKVVWLEEFDKTTPDMRGALRGFIEEYTHVRFIATLNNINVLSRTEEDKALLSRFTLINFDPQDKEEISYLKEQYRLYLKAVSNNVKLNLNDEIITTIINKSFPNLRIAIQKLQEIFISGDYNTYIKQKTILNEELYLFILNKDNNLNENFFFVMDNYPKEKTEELLQLLSGNFFKYLIENESDIIMKNGFKILNLIKEYNAEYLNTTDPETHLVSYITNLKDLMKLN